MADILDDFAAAAAAWKKLDSADNMPDWEVANYALKRLETQRAASEHAASAVERHAACAAVGPWTTAASTTTPESVAADEIGTWISKARSGLQFCEVLEQPLQEGLARMVSRSGIDSSWRMEPVRCRSCTRWEALLASAAGTDVPDNWTGHWFPCHRKALSAGASVTAVAEHAAAASVEGAAANIHYWKRTAHHHLSATNWSCSAVMLDPPKLDC